MVKSRGKRGGFDTSSTISLDGLSDEIVDNDIMVSNIFTNTSTDTSSRLTDSERPTTTTNYILENAFLEDEDEVYITPDPNVDNEIFGDLTFGGSRRTKRTKRTSRKRKTNKRRVKKRTSRRKRKTSRYYGGQPASSPSSNYTNRLTDTYRIN